MAKDLLTILKEVRGTGAPEAEYTDGIYHDLTIKTTEDDNITPRLGAGIYGSIRTIYNRLEMLSGMSDELAVLEGMSSELHSLYTDKAVLDSIYADKVTLASIHSDKAILDSIYTDKLKLDSLYADKLILDSLFTDKSRLDSLFTDKSKLDSLYADKAKLDSLYADKTKLDRLFTSIANIDRVSVDIGSVVTTATNVASVNTVATNIVGVVSVANTVVPNIAEILLADNNAAKATAKAAEALASANNAAASYDSFDDRYLGAKATAPNVDNDGDTLLQGAMYWDTVLISMRVWSGTAWSSALTLTESSNSTLTNKTIDDISNTVGADHVHYRCRNTSGSTIAANTVVTMQGVQGNTDYIEVVPLTNAQTQIALGIVHTGLANNATGLVSNTGVVNNIDTSAWAVGTLLYPNNSGGFTSTKPTSGWYQAVAVVLRQNGSTGTLLVEFTEPNPIGSTTQTGYVQLNNTLTSTSTTQALTAAQGNVLANSKVAVNTTITAGTSTKITYDAKGLVTSGTTLAATDIPPLDTSKITTGTLPVLRGGTGVTVSTGTGSNVLSTSPTLTTPVLGVATGTSFNSITALAATTSPMDGVAAVGVSTTVARQDHVHPTDTTRQPLDATLTALAGVTTAADKMIYATGIDTFTTTTLTAAGRALIDDVDAVAQRTTLGISATNTPIAAVGGIVATNVQAALTELDAEKAPLSSPAFTGTPTAPTAVAGTNTTQVATTAFVNAEIANDIVAPLALKANLASPAFTDTPTAPTAAVGTNTTQVATTAFVQAFDDVAKANLASPAFTGTPTAPTAVAGTNTTQVATTAFVQAFDDVAKANLASPAFTGTVVLPSTTSIGTITNTELSYVDGVTSSIQAQLNTKVTFGDLESQLDLKSPYDFTKPIRAVPLFTKASVSTITIPIGTVVKVGETTIAVGSIVTLSLNSVGVNALDTGTKVAGTDYYVYALEAGSFIVSANATNPSGYTTLNSRKIGGFHYSLIPEAEALNGNKTEADMVKIRGINAYTLWDLKYFASAGNNGMFIANGKCYDIYLLNSEHIVNGTSKAGATIAGGGVENGRLYPKIPLAFGGNGTTTYGKLPWFAAADIGNSHGKRMISYEEFTAIAYGVVEASSSADASASVKHIANFTSRFGMEQATGHQWIWSADVFSDTVGTYTWQAVTDGRGSVLAVDTAINAAILGGGWDNAVYAGSRASLWIYRLLYTGWGLGCRFACDLVILD